MKQRVSIFASLPLALLLTGCPLTDHYELQHGSTAGVGAGGDWDAAAGGEPAVGDAGDPSMSGGPNLSSGGRGGGDSVAGGGGDKETAGGPNCSKACNAGRTCVGTSCDGGWVGMSAPPTQLVARSKAASVALSNAVFIWGGLDNAGTALGNGAIYYPATDEWNFVPMDPGSPAARINATAVWTGNASNKVIVYGGTDASGAMVFRDGAVYDLLTNSWAQLMPNPTTGKRSAPYGYWDGTRAIFFGGLNGTAVVTGADRFDLQKWSTSTNSGDPGLLGFPAIAFDGTVMYLQGGVVGSTRQDKVFAYTSSTDKWATLPTGPSVRTGAFGAWDGTHFVVWGGQDDDGMRNDGKTMSGSTWSDMSTSNVLSARRIGFRRSGWAFQAKPGVVAIIGGQTSTTASSSTLATDGASYDVQSGEWTAIASWTSEETHEYGIGVWTGEEFVLWGGRDQNVSTLTGERWAP